MIHSLRLSTPISTTCYIAHLFAGQLEKGEPYACYPENANSGSVNENACPRNLGPARQTKSACIPVAVAAARAVERERPPARSGDAGCLAKAPLGQLAERLLHITNELVAA